MSLYDGVQTRSVRANRSVAAMESWRSHLIFGVLVLGMLVLVGRAFQLQVLNHRFLGSEGDKRAVRELVVPGGRGAVFDRNGQPLALAAPVESVWAVPSELLTADDNELARLAKLLGQSSRQLKQHLEQRRSRGFVYLRRQLDPEHARHVVELKLPGVFLQREYRRYYPAAEAAAQLVGVTNIDLNGQEGLELALNATLKGEDGSRRVIKDRKGRVVEDLAQFRQPEPGQDVTLSIDLRLQYLAYRELKRATLENKAAGGVVVIIDPQTGEILALASDPSYNPNRREAFKPAAMRERAITDLFEPGSTIKPFVVAAGMDHKLVNTHTLIDTEQGRWRVGRLLVKDVHNYGTVDLTTLLMKSSNVGAAKIGMKLGADALHQLYRQLGIGQPSGIEFPGEAVGVLHATQKWGQVGTATASYGYGFSATAVQMARAYSALATDGVIPKLTLHRREDDSPVEVTRVFNAKTARAVRGMLEHVVGEKGTAKRAAVEGYRMAGKTGTVHKVAAGGGYDGHDYQSLFIGMAPASNPRMVIVVMIDDPEGDTHYGGTVAAPVFSGILNDGLRILRIPPDQLPPAVTAESQTTAGARS